jgi:hypothetical protein
MSLLSDSTARSCARLLSVPGTGSKFSGFFAPDSCSTSLLSPAGAGSSAAQRQQIIAVIPLGMPQR